jgi:hypothetical protein
VGGSRSRASRAVYLVGVPEQASHGGEATAHCHDCPCDLAALDGRGTSGAVCTKVDGRRRRRPGAGSPPARRPARRTERRNRPGAQPPQRRRVPGLRGRLRHRHRRRAHGRGRRGLGDRGQPEPLHHAVRAPARRGYHGHPDRHRPTAHESAGGSLCQRAREGCCFAASVTAAWRSCYRRVAGRGCTASGCRTGSLPRVR